MYSARFNLGNLKLKTFIFAMICPISVFAAGDENSVSKLNNMTKAGSDSYYLVRDKIWSEEGCVIDGGKERINPGESSSLEIKKGCTWGGIKYKIFKMTDNADLGYLSHSFQDGAFRLEIAAPCKGSECNFYDLNPDQHRK